MKLLIPLYRKVALNILKLTPDIDISGSHDQMVIHHIWNSHVNSTCVPPCLGSPDVRKGQSTGDDCVSGASDTSDVSA